MSTPSSDPRYYKLASYTPSLRSVEPDTPPPRKLRPLVLTDINTSSNPYRALSAKRASDDHLYTLKNTDAALKRQIRTLRVVSRTLAVLLSIAVLVPITMTLIKFLSTRSVFKDVDLPGGGSVHRNAWAKNGITWPTYMYFGLAATSVSLNSLILVAYYFSVKAANKTAVVASTFAFVEVLTNLVFWIVGAALYKQQKDANSNKDIWGWTCSPAARAIQDAFREQVSFDQYCNVQSASWYAGLVQVGALTLTLVIYALTYRRLKYKKRMERLGNEIHL